MTVLYSDLPPYQEPLVHIWNLRASSGIARSCQLNRSAACLHTRPTVLRVEIWGCFPWIFTPLCINIFVYFDLYDNEYIQCGLRLSSGVFL